MYCKKCGTKQQDGQKFCPKCGTPYGEIKQANEEVVCKVSEKQVEQEQLEEKAPVKPDVIQSDSDGAETKHVHEDVESSLPKQNVVQQDKNDTKYDFNPEDVKSVGRVFVVGLGIAIIVVPFLMHGFSFGLFWYLPIIAVGYLLYKIFEKGVKSLSIPEIKKGIIAFFIIGFVMFMWGPLSPSYYRGGNNLDNSYSEESNIPTWLTKYKFVCKEYGGTSGVNCYIRFYDNGTGSMSFYFYERKSSKSQFDYSVRGDYIYISFEDGTSETMQLIYSSSSLKASNGEIFVQTIL